MATHWYNVSVVDGVPTNSQYYLANYHREIVQTKLVNTLLTYMRSFIWENFNELSNQKVIRKMEARGDGISVRTEKYYLHNRNIPNGRLIFFHPRLFKKITLDNLKENEQNDKR